MPILQIPPCLKPDPFLHHSKNFSAGGPSASMYTLPSDRFLINPLIPRVFASLAALHLNPTTWTYPFI